MDIIKKSVCIYFFITLLVNLPVVCNATNVTSGDTIQCSASASDSDCDYTGDCPQSVTDTVTVTWSVKWKVSGEPAGTFPGGNTGTPVQWKAPDTGGEVVITANASDSGTMYNESGSASVTVTVVKVEINLAASQSCDGMAVNVDLVVTPVSMKSQLTSVQLTAAEAVTNFGSPSGQGITFSQRGDITQWQIDNARWYSTQADHCNDDADWEIEAIYEIAGSHTCNTHPPVTFTASAAFGTCLNGAADVTNTFSGSPQYTTVFNSQTSLYETTVAQGTFVRDVQATSWWTVAGGTSSQYYDMMSGEEQYHEQQQMENAGHVRWGTCLLVANIMSDVQANQPYTDPTEAESLAKAQNAFANAKNDEITRSWNYLSQQSVICADESEAKNAVGSSHKVDMPCTYPACP
ncbi:MAG: hypothetical protein JRL30_29745 [Deltaproteobacteria bacterium]|nr:hypothetical protein [Deltaproteobacteria bacterium]